VRHVASGTGVASSPRCPYVADRCDHPLPAGGVISPRGFTIPLLVQLIRSGCDGRAGPYGGARRLQMSLDIIGLFQARLQLTVILIWMIHNTAAVGRDLCSAGQPKGQFICV
jgi:hypothetical protein